MATVALQQVSSSFARENAGRTLDKPVGLKFISRYITPELLASLEAQCQDNAVFIWGSKEERSHQTYKVVGKQALFFFRRDQQIYKYGIVIEKTVNQALAESLWGTDVSGESWSTIYFFSRIKNKFIPASQINKLLGRSEKDNWQGLVVLSMKDSEKVDAFFNRELQQP